jgi:bifunctional ADP-heptose synthase (sugar kinase/adenylyltransferase)
MDTRPKIISAADLPAPPYTLVAARLPALTAEHCRALAAARVPGRPLVVALAADSYGGPYPLDERSRAQLAAALAAVDHVVICDQPETERLRAAAGPGAVVDLESQVGRDIIADVLERHPPA